VIYARPRPLVIFWCFVRSHSIFSHSLPTARSSIKFQFQWVKWYWPSIDLASVTLAEIIKKRFQRPLTPPKPASVTKNRPGPSRQRYAQLNTSLKILSTEIWTLFDEFAFTKSHIIFLRDLTVVGNGISALLLSPGIQGNAIMDDVGVIRKLEAINSFLIPRKKVVSSFEGDVTPQSASI